jgi:hypothetical protein
MRCGREYRRGMKEFDGSREIEIRIRGAQGRDADGAGIGSDENRGGARSLKRGAIFEICEECKVGGSRVLDSCDASDFGVRVAFELAAEFFGDFSKFHADSPSRPHCILVFGGRSVQKSAPANESGVQKSSFCND